MFTQQHYEALARELRTAMTLPNVTPDMRLGMVVVVARMSAMFKQDSARFRQDKFCRACGVQAVSSTPLAADK